MNGKLSPQPPEVFQSHLVWSLWKSNGPTTRWRDVDLLDHSLVIRRSKTRAGERVIPLNASSYNAIMRLRERAQGLFGSDLQPDWYVFPRAEGYSKPDPTKPMSGWRSAWRSLTRAITCPACNALQNPAAKAAVGFWPRATSIPLFTTVHRILLIFRNPWTWVLGRILTVDNTVGDRP